MTPETPPFEKLLTPDEVLEVLRGERRTLMKLLREARLRGVKVGKAWRIPESALRTFIEQGGSVSDSNSPQYRRGKYNLAEEE